MQYRPQTAIAALFTLLFLVSVPLVLLSTAGYRINLRTRRLEQTGILVLRSAPVDADVLLDGTMQEDQTPVRFSQLLPREYRVTVQKAGYRGWEKVLSVESRRTTFAEDIVLFPDQLPVRDADAAARTLAVSQDGTLAYDDTVGGSTEIRLRARSGTETVGTRLAATGTPQFSWSPSGDQLLVTSGSGTSPALIDIRSGQSRVLTLPAPLLSSSWSAGGSEDLFLLAGDQPLIVPDGGVPQPFTAAPAALLWHQDGLIHVGRVATITDSGDRAFRIDVHGANGTVLRERFLSIPFGDVRFLPSPPGLLTLIANGYIRVYETESGRFLHSSNARDAAWRPDGERELLIWTDLELRIFRPEGGGGLITRVGEPIRQAAWYPGGSHVLFATGDTVSAVERDSRDGRVATPLFTLPALGAFAVDTKGAAIVAIAAPGGRPGIYRYPIIVP